MDGRRPARAGHRTRRTGRLVRHVPGRGRGVPSELLVLLGVIGRPWSTLVVVVRPGDALTPWRRPDHGRAYRTPQAFRRRPASVKPSLTQSSRVTVVWNGPLRVARPGPARRSRRREARRAREAAHVGITSGCRVLRVAGSPALGP